MTSRLLTLLAATSASMLLAACGGGGDNDSSSTPTPTIDRPVARTSAASTTVELDGTVTLDGTASSSPRGAALNYLWTLQNRPDGSAAGFADATLAQPSFRADQYGDYVVSLIVNDGTANSLPSEPLTITAPNPDPVARITQLSSVGILGWARLDGSASLPPTGGDASRLTFQWTLAAPTGSSASLSDPTAAQPSFLADVAGVYTVQLIVSYNDRTSATATHTLNISPANAVPVADPGGEVGTANRRIYRAVRGERIVLDGSKSDDADEAHKGKLSYSWRFLRSGQLNTPDAAVPTGSQVRELTDSRTAAPSFVPDAAGTYYVQLYVHDGISRSQPAYAQVEVSKRDTDPNQKPAMLMYGGLTTWHVEVNETFWFTNLQKYDLDLATYFEFPTTYEWLQTPAGFQPPATITTNFMPTHEGTYRLRITIEDDLGAKSDPLELTINASLGGQANGIPIAEAEAPFATALIGEPARFDGSKSNDPDGDRMTYEWSWVERPVGSTAAFQDNTAVTAEFTPDLAGAYIAELVVSDAVSSSTQHVTRRRAYATVLAKGSNHAPDMDLKFSNGLDSLSQPIIFGDITTTCQTNASGTTNCQTIGEPSIGFNANGFDPDGDTLYHRWTVEQQPENAQVSMDDLTTQSTNSIKFRAPGDYRIKAELSDGIAYAAPQSLAFHAYRFADRNWPAGIVVFEHYQYDLHKTWFVSQPVNGDLQAANSFFIRNTGASTPAARRNLAIRLNALPGERYTIRNAVITPDNEASQAVQLSVAHMNGQVLESSKPLQFSVDHPAIPYNDGGRRGRNYINYFYKLSFSLEETGETYTSHVGMSVNPPSDPDFAYFD